VQEVAGGGELFDTLTVFENYPVDDGSRSADLDGLRLRSISGRDVTHYPLSLQVVPGERLRLRLDYRGDLFERAGIEALAGRFVRLLGAAVATPDRPVGRLGILSAAGRGPVLRGGDGTPPGVPAATPAGLFAAPVRRTPP